MGACCTTEQKINMKTLIFIQSGVRRWIARRRREQMRLDYINEITGVSKSQHDAVTTQPLFSPEEIEAAANDSTKRYLIKYETPSGDADDHITNKTYSGEWAYINGQMVKDGFGVLTWADGSKYEGQFRDDKMSGQGRMTQANGDTYQGQWANGMANGYGTFVDSQGSTYEGEWMDDLQHGYGCETWSQGKIKFEGNYFQGKKNGKGRYEWQDGSYYEGDFVDSMFCGEGVYYFAESEKTYEGQFQQNVFEGAGKLQFKDGRRYDGQFKGGKKHGQGTMQFPNGNKYIGEWQFDVQHGMGIFYSNKEGTKRQGQWKEGKRTAWLSQVIKTGGKR